MKNAPELAFLSVFVITMVSIIAYIYQLSTSGGVHMSDLAQAITNTAFNFRK